MQRSYTTIDLLFSCRPTDKFPKNPFTFVSCNVTLPELGNLEEQVRKESPRTFFLDISKKGHSISLSHSNIPGLHANELMSHALKVNS